MKIVLFILLLLVFLLLLIVLIPIKIKINYNVEDESKKDNLKKEIDRKTRDNFAKIYILYFIPLPKIELQVHKNSKLIENRGVLKNIINTIFSLFMEFIGMQKSTEALLDRKDIYTIKNSIYFKEINLNFGYNFYSMIINAYVVAFLNTIVPIYIVQNNNMFNLKKCKYNTYISNNQIYNLKFFSIVKFKFANTISIFIKAFIKLRKVVKNNGKGNTSNRRLNDDCYDIS